MLLALLSLLACPPPVNDDTSNGDDTGTPDTAPVGPATLTVVGFNVESGDSDVFTVAELVEGVQGEHIWGFSEVQNSDWARTFQQAARDADAELWSNVVGSTGNADKLSVVWNTDHYEMISWKELHDINVGGTARAPLVAHMKHRASGLEFQFMVNHLWRTQESSRHEQAQRLQDWALEQALPVVAVGDYNFDWRVDGGNVDHDLGFDYMTAENAWRWVRPDPMERTQCSGWGEGSVLDFTFVAGAAQDWEATSEVLAPSDYCDFEDDQQADHRPVAATFVLPE